MHNNLPAGDDDQEGEGYSAHLLSTQYVCTSTGSLELVGTHVDSPTGTLQAFESMYHRREEKATPTDILKEIVSKKWRKFSVKRTLSKNFPTLSALRRYKLKEYLPNDIVAGLTVGITMIPQGMAFASLSTLPPIVGLYISFFASLTYFLLGTSHQLSWGCVAVLSILMGNILDSYEAKVKAAFGFDSDSQSVPSSVASAINTTNISFGPLSTVSSMEDTLSTVPSMQGTDPLQEALSVQKKIEVAGAVTLISGIILAILGKLGLGRLTTFMSDSLITSFTVGVSFHVVSSQIKAALDLNIPRQRGIFKLIYLWIDMLQNIHQTNVATLIISVICMAILYLVKRFVSEKYKAKLPVPFPIELFVIIVVTVITTFTGLTDKYSVSVVKEVPVGVPSPRIPDLSLGNDYVTDGLIIIIVSFTQNIAMAKLMGLKHNYRIDSNQEMFACGVVSVVCSFFSGYISGPSVSRSIVQDGAGGKTQVASLFAAALVFFVIMVIGPYFYYLPKCVLAAIIIVNLRSMFLKMTTIPALWRKSRADALVWIITCACTVFLETDIGLLIGIVVCILFVLMRSQINTVDTVAEICAGDNHVWRSENRYLDGKTIHGVKVIKINCALYFANAEIMTDQVFKKTGLNPMKMARTKVADVKHNKVSSDEGSKRSPVKSEQVDHLRGSADLKNGLREMKKDVDVNLDLGTRGDHDICIESAENCGMPFQSLIVQLSSVSFVDVMGVQAMEFLIMKYQGVGISVYFADAQENCVETLHKCGFLSKYKDVVFVTTEAALQHIQAGLAST